MGYFIRREDYCCVVEMSPQANHAYIFVVGGQTIYYLFPLGLQKRHRRQHQTSLQSTCRVQPFTNLSRHTQRVVRLLSVHLGCRLLKHRCEQQVAVYLLSIILNVQPTSCLPYWAPYRLQERSRIRWMLEYWFVERSEPVAAVRQYSSPCGNRFGYE